jgi:hypothetical protein
MADVNRPDARGSSLQQAIGKTAGGTADIDANLAVHVDAEVFQGRGEFQTAPAYIRKPRSNVDFAVARYGAAGFVALLSADKNIACQDQCASLFAGICQTALDEELIHPYFGGA